MHRSDPVVLDRELHLPCRFVATVSLAERQDLRELGGVKTCRRGHNSNQLGVKLVTCLISSCLVKKLFLGTEEL